MLILIIVTRNVIYGKLNMYLQNSTYLHLRMLSRVFRDQFSLNEERRRYSHSKSK